MGILYSKWGLVWIFESSGGVDIWEVEFKVGFGV